MAVRIRLMRMGKKKTPSYRVVVMDGRKPRNGRYIEQIGRYNPLLEPSLIEIQNDRAVEWLQKGAQPSERVRRLMEISGAWTRYRVAAGKAHRLSDDPVAKPAAVSADATETPQATPEAATADVSAS